MRKFDSVISLLLIVFAIYWGFKTSMPSYTNDLHSKNSTFSTDRALAHVKNIAKAPHGVGFPAHKIVRDYIVSELASMGLKTYLQEGYTAGDWGNVSKATNIITRIKGTGKGKALLLLSHYDSSPHSSLGASDAGSGVATILEGIRVFLSKNVVPKNDIIVLISDSEELGLNGADLFVNSHPWAKDVGLVLNFEARGSGGPSYMLIETNRGNANLIKEFTSANPQFPVANSLAYSIYKMLPNDTDLTVFREDADIEGFNFAFIDDHFDYHTVRDNYARLDRNSLAHQGSYLMPLLDHFSMSDLNTLKSFDDYMYFNVPHFGLVSYPFSWIWLMFVISLVFFTTLVVLGFLRGILTSREVLKGFIPLLLAVVFNGTVGYFSWSLLKRAYPHYQDILQGFTYNGYEYIAAFVFFSTGICFWLYHKYRSISTANLLVAPLTLWLAICGALSVYLEGASFFIIPVLALLFSFFIILLQKRPTLYVLVVLALPALWLLAPLVKMLPVGLGLKVLVGSTLLVTTLFFLLLPVFGFYKKKNRLALLCMLLFVGGMISAHIKSGFSKEHANPSSLVYILDADENIAQWSTYDHVLSNWTKNYINIDNHTAEDVDRTSISSKYDSKFTRKSPAPIKDIPQMTINKTKDTILGDFGRLIKLGFTHNRPVNRLDIYTNDVPLHRVIVNGIQLSDTYLGERQGGRLLTHYISENAETELTILLPKDLPLEIKLYEASNDLLSNTLFTVPERPSSEIPKPFVLNDAVLVTKTVQY